MTRAALLTPHLYHGGPRGWMLDLLARVKTVEWLGVACLDSRWVDSAIVREYEAVTKVYGFTPSAVRRVLAADVLIAWGVQNMDEAVPASYRGRVIFVSKGADVDFTRPAIAGGLKRVTDWVASSEAALAPFDGLVPRERITIIPNGVRPEHCTATLTRERARRILGFRDDQIVCAFVGRYSAEKRPLLLAKALALLPKRFCGLWVGAGPEEAQNRAEIASRLADRAVFCPPVPTIGNVFAACDLVVAPSVSEGFGYVQAEAMWARVPLIATPTGILPTIDGQTPGEKCWTQVPCNATAGQLAAAIRKTAILPEREKQQRAEAGHRVIQKHYTVDRMAATWQKFLASQGKAAP